MHVEHVPCPICNSEAASPPSVTLTVDYDCTRCGRFRITSQALTILRHEKWTPRQVANASGWIREHAGVLISTDEIGFLGALRSPTVDERGGKLLLELENRSVVIGKEFSFKLSDNAQISTWLATSWSQDAGELQYLLSHYLKQLGWISAQDEVGGMIHRVFITPQGYDRLAKMRQKGGGSSIGFCAMWFDPSLRDVWIDAIKPAIEAAGYKAERIDNVQHNNKIDDEIVAMIRRSRFVVADFTGNRGGVYFEAGFAMGLSIPVIWTVSELDLHQVHFDNRQYNFVVWNPAKLAEFKTALENRIEATLGAGPLKT